MLVGNKVSEGLHAQLVKEVTAGHILHGKTHDLSVVAGKPTNDDILVVSKGDPKTGYFVHLTWNPTSGQKDPYWPYTQALEAEEIEKITGAAAPVDAFPPFREELK